MDPLLLLGLKAVLAGLAVAAFSLLSSATSPKMFSGLFAAAPVVAGVSLLLTALTKPPAALEGARGMIVGAVAMISCCLLVGVLLPRLHAVLASAAGWLAWAAVATAGYLLVFD